jgi:hypothetical protein
MDLAFEDIGKTGWAGQTILDAKEVGRKFAEAKEVKTEFVFALRFYIRLRAFSGGHFHPQPPVE